VSRKRQRISVANLALMILAALVVGLITANAKPRNVNNCESLGKSISK
jgi:hypothetical protein